MDKSQSGKSPAYDPDQPSYEEERQRTRTRTRTRTSGSGTPNLHQRSTETSPQDNRQRSPLTFESENILDDIAFEDDTDPWSDRRSTSRSPQSAGRRSPEKQDKDKGKARGKERVAMSSGPGGGGGTSQSGTSEEPSHRERIAQLPTPMYPGKDQKGQEAKPKARREAISAQAQAPALALAAIDQGWSRGSL
nr:hypothetical protein LTR18_001703 [Exophiala xenobiotica]